MKRVILFSAFLGLLYVLHATTLMPVNAEELSSQDQELSYEIQEKNSKLVKHLKDKYREGMSIDDALAEYDTTNPIGKEYASISEAAEGVMLAKKIYSDEIIDEEVIHDNGIIQRTNIIITFYSDGSYMVDTLRYETKTSSSGDLFASSSNIPRPIWTSGNNTHERYFNILGKRVLFWRTYLQCSFSCNNDYAFCMSSSGNARTHTLYSAYRRQPVETHPKEAPYYGKLSRVSMYTEIKGNIDDNFYAADNIIVSCGPDGAIYRN